MKNIKLRMTSAVVVKSLFLVQSTGTRSSCLYIACKYSRWPQSSNNTWIWSSEAICLSGFKILILKMTKKRHPSSGQKLVKNLTKNCASYRLTFTRSWVWYWNQLTDQVYSLTGALKILLVLKGGTRGPFSIFSVLWDILWPGQGS